jgi:hypothetical protein
MTNPKAKPAARSARSSASRQSSVDIEEEEDVANFVHQEHPTNPNRILEKADGSDDDPDHPPRMDVDVDVDVDEEDSVQEEEPVEESAESELGEFLIDMNQCNPQRSL